MNKFYSNSEVLKWYEMYKDHTIPTKHVAHHFKIKPQTLLRRFKKLNLKLKPSGFRTDNRLGRYGHDVNKLKYMWFKTHAYQRRCKKKNREFSLTDDQFYQLVTGDCFHCGKLFGSETRTIRNVSIPMFTIDRLDSSVGYTIHNCVTSCHRCNIMKGDMPHSEWLEHIMTILKKSGKL